MLRFWCISPHAVPCSMKHSLVIREAWKRAYWSLGQWLSALCRLRHTRGLWQAVMCGREKSAGGCRPAADRGSRSLPLSPVKHHAGQTHTQQITLYHFIKSSVSHVCLPPTPQRVNPTPKLAIKALTFRLQRQALITSLHGIKILYHTPHLFTSLLFNYL